VQAGKGTISGWEITAKSKYEFRRNEKWEQI
jgi:hypothetical protein